MTPYRPGSGKTGRVNKGFRDREVNGCVLRTCNACNLEKPLDEFAANAASKLGKRSYCRECWRPRHTATEKARRALVRHRANLSAAKGRAA